MSNQDEQMKIPLAWAATIVSTIIGVAMQAGVAHYRIGELEHQLVEFRAVQVVSAKTNEQHELKLQRLEITLGNISDKLDGIAQKLDRFEEGRRNVRP
jgi:hypothetical protein